MTRPTHRTPSLRAHLYRSDLPKVVTVYDNRFWPPVCSKHYKGKQMW